MLYAHPLCQPVRILKECADLLAIGVSGPESCFGDGSWLTSLSTVPAEQPSAIASVLVSSLGLIGRHQHDVHQRSSIASITSATPASTVACTKGEGLSWKLWLDQKGSRILRGRGSSIDSSTQHLNGYFTTPSLTVQPPARAEKQNLRLALVSRNMFTLVYSGRQHCQLRRIGPDGQSAWQARECVMVQQEGEIQKRQGRRMFVQE